LDGKDFKPAEVGKRSVYIFVNTVCGMCTRELGEVVKNMDVFKGAELFVVVIDQETERAVARYKGLPAGVTLLHDPDFAMGETVDLFSTPATLVLDKDNKILFKEAGYRPDLLKTVKEIVSK